MVELSGADLWIDSQEKSILQLLLGWVKINTHSHNLNGINEQSRQMAEAFADIAGTTRWHELSPLELINHEGQIEHQTLANALQMKTRPQAPNQVLLVCHCDTVYPIDHPFQDISRESDIKILGPGITDAKGGIAVMLTALRAFEQLPLELKEMLGWSVFINPDEEIGSPGSKEVLQKIASQHRWGLVFEPCLPDGNLVGNRKGSGNFTLVVHGRSAHAGREHHLGRNAVAGLAECISKINSLNGKRPGLTVNVGLIEGGQALNVVPDQAIARFNIRIEKPEDEAHVWVALKRIMSSVEKKHEGLRAELHGGFFAPPKILDQPAKKLYEDVRVCGESMGLDLKWSPTGGVCDGNRLSSYGLPNVDTLGVKGGHLHSSNEYLNVPSLTERSRLALRVLVRLAQYQS